MHNARAQQWIEDIRAAKAAQSEQEVLVLPPTPTGHVPELQLEEGRFKAYGFVHWKRRRRGFPIRGPAALMPSSNGISPKATSVEVDAPVTEAAPQAVDRTWASTNTTERSGRTTGRWKGGKKKRGNSG